MSSWFQACLPRINIEHDVWIANRRKHLSRLTGVQAPADATLDELVAHSKAFPHPFPVKTPLVRSLLARPDIAPEQLADHATSAYPLLLEDALFLIMDFLEFKRLHGSEVERLLYADMGVVDLVHGLLEKRAVSFYGAGDYYCLLSGEKGYGGWEDVGTHKENPPLTLKHCLSYDEMKLSSLLSVSSHTVFINDGGRMNRGIVSSIPESVEKYGVIVGLIGPRLERMGANEWQEVLVTEQQNTEENGYGSQSRESQDSKRLWRGIWARFYNIEPNLPSYKEACKDLKTWKFKAPRRFTKLNDAELFDNLVYQKRIAVSVETLLLEAEHRAAAAQTTAFVHVVGIGLGVWSVSDHQQKEFLSVFGKCLDQLGPVLRHVSDVRFGWFSENQCGGVKDGGLTASGIRLHFDQSPPHSALRDEHAGKLLVVTYAWDMNALPGNEFWCGLLCSSGDPAAACSTQISELHNPHVNRAKVCGANLHIASAAWGVLHVAEYARRKEKLPLN